MFQDTAEELLLHCLRTAIDESGWERLRYRPNADWDAVAQLAIRHGVAGLVYQPLQAHASDLNVPPHALQRLREAFLINTARNLSLYQSLHKVLKALTGDGIPLLVLKGAHLAKAAYGHIGHRTMGDMDILVRPDDLARVGPILRGLHYTPTADSVRLEREHYHYIYEADDGTATVEIHWHIQPPTSSSRVDLESVWDRAQPLTVAGVTVLALCPEDALLHVCLHSSLHHFFRWFGVRSLCDVAVICHRWQSRLDWAQVQQRASEWSIGNAAYLTLRLARDLLGAAVPVPLLHDLAPVAFDTRLVNWAVRSIFTNVTNTETDPASLSDHLGDMWAARRLSDRMAALLRACFPPPRRLAQLRSLPDDSRRVVLHYPAHLVDLLRQRGRTIWLLLRRDAATVAWADREAGRMALMKWLASPGERR